MKKSPLQLAFIPSLVWKVLEVPRSEAWGEWMKNCFERALFFFKLKKKKKKKKKSRRLGLRSDPSLQMHKDKPFLCIFFG